MRLKKIKIIGFKSFAEKTTLEFHEGITAIVGPNGCGKSNIADAFRWVLGEQSAKSMRGSKMPDVIFAGSKQRKPLNYAEVTLTLTDVEGELPTEYAELEVTRRLHRSGESEYLINGHQVRMRDVQSLFLDSGVGKQSFSIFEQGKIEQVINSSPLERRTIFEEAAGILRFLQRKREALRKLEQADQNILRVKDIHQEVEQQIVVLEEQAEQARSYKERQSKLEQLEKHYYVAKWDRFGEKEVVSAKEENARQKAIDALHHEIEVSEQELHDLKEKLAATQKLMHAKSEEVFQTRSDKEIKTQERQTSQERLAEALVKEKRWKKELETMASKRKERKVESEQKKKEQAKIDKELQKHAGKREAQRAKVAALEEKVGVLRAELQVFQRQQFVLMQVENQSASETKQQQLNLQHLQEKTEKIIERKERLLHRQQERKEEIASNRTHLEKGSKEIGSKKEAFANLESTLTELTDEMDKTQEEMDALHRELTQKAARENALKRLREEMEGFSDGAKKLLQASADSNSPLHGLVQPLYEWIIPIKGMEAALSVIMRPYAGTLTVKTKKHFDLVVDYAQKEGFRDFSLICQENLSKKKRSIRKKGETLLQKVSKNPYSKHFLGAIDIVDTLQGALKTSENESWARDGCFYDRFGVVFYAGTGDKNVFLREAELKSLTRKKSEMKTDHGKLDKVLTALQDKKSGVHAERMSLDKVIRTEEMKLVEVNFSLQGLIADEKSAETEIDAFEKEINAFQKEVHTLDKALQTSMKRHALASEKVSEGEKKVESLTASVEKQVAHLSSEQQELQRIESAFQEISENYRKVVHALNVIEVQEIEGLQQEKRIQEEMESSRGIQQEIQQKNKTYDMLIQSVEKSLEKVTKACAAVEKKVDDQKVGIEKSEKKLASKRESLQQLEKHLYQAGIKSAQIGAARQALQEEVQEHFQTTCEKLKEQGFLSQATLEELEVPIRDLKQELKAAGDINMMSIDECEKHKSRYTFLNQQMDDLYDSKTELIEIIAQLDTESRKIFQETFDQIRINFQKNFAILFNGGEADLKLIDSDDVLEAGVEIIARPPEKKMRSINLLSGGEKCLTAVALLFAIFEVRPAPFCILDEVDAPLDDSNVERFVNVVKQFIDTCQFIIITHNKRTMAIADILFGVSMQEKGVSKLLSIAFARNEQEAPTPEPVLA